MRQSPPKGAVPPAPSAQRKPDTTESVPTLHPLALIRALA